MHAVGRPFKGELHSTDASAGAEITLYENGSLDAYTLKDHEYLEIHLIQLITAAGGDAFVFTGADATEAAGEYVVRGTFAANGGIAQEVITPPHAGGKGHKAYVQAPAGAVDVVIRGVIRQEGEGDRPSWKEADFGQ